jgi:hypothetical protein
MAYEECLNCVKSTHSDFMNKNSKYFEVWSEATLKTNFRFKELHLCIALRQLYYCKAARKVSSSQCYKHYNVEVLQHGFDACGNSFQHVDCSLADGYSFR